MTLRIAGLSMSFLISELSLHGDANGINDRRFQFHDVVEQRQVGNRQNSR